MKIIHTADWHFSEKNFDEIYKCVSCIVHDAKSIKPDLICISGDITDSKNLSLDSKSARAILHIIGDMLDIAPVAIIIGTPSHDGHAALALRECRGKYPILVSDMPGRFAYDDYQKKWIPTNSMIFPNDKPSFVVTQIPQPTKQFFVNDMCIEDTEKAISRAMGVMLASFSEFPTELENLPKIVNGHGQIGGAFISETQQLIGRDIEVSKSQLLSMNHDLICYGHIHKAQDMGSNIFYAGSPTRMNFGETEEKGFYVHEIRSHKDHNQPCLSRISEFIKLPARDMISIKDDYTELDKGLDINDLIETLSKMPDNLYSPGTHVKFEIKAWQDEAANISSSKIELSFKNAGAEKVIVSIVRVPRETVRAVKVLEAETLPDKVAAMATLRGENISLSILEKASILHSGDVEPWNVNSNL